MNDPNQAHKSSAQRLSAGLIAEFQKSHFDIFGEHISPELAEAELLGLAELVEITGHTHLPADKDVKDGAENES